MIQFRVHGSGLYSKILDTLVSTYALKREEEGDNYKTVV